MATGTSGSTTTNFDLILPGYEDDTDVDDLNENFKTIDDELYDATQAIAQNASAIQTVQDSVSIVSDTIGVGNLGWTQITNLSNVSQLTHNGFYHVNTCSNITSKFTDYGTGDFMMLLMSNNFTNGHVGYGKLIITTPRWSSKIWVINIWESSFNDAFKIGT